jgi:DNA-binding CsgD family transcriptional regulator
LTIDMVNFLLVRPSFDEIAQHMCATLFAPYQPWSTTIFRCTDRGYARVLGDFGSPVKASSDLSGFDCSTHSPVARALFQGATVSNFQTDQRTSPAGDADFHWFVEGPAILHPLSAPSRFLGAVHMRFLEEPDTDTLLRDLAGVAPALSLHLETVCPTPGAQQQRFVSTSSLPVPDELSQRQLQVLALMAEQKTNAQISRIIGYSESTVRQETMAIFRYLGVHDRREAAKVASLRGLLAEAA